MTIRRANTPGSISLAIGTCVAAGIASPALAAKFDMPVLTPPDYILGGLLLLLVVALVVRLVKHHDEEIAAPSGSDMRWWQNPQT